MMVSFVKMSSSRLSNRTSMMKIR